MPTSPAAALDAALDRLRDAGPSPCAEAAAAELAAGTAAIEVLVRLSGDADARCRAEAVYALAELGNAVDVEVFRKALKDTDERVRAYAAVGLARAGDAGAVDALLTTLDDGDDPLHADITPAVRALAEMGLPAAPALLERMESAPSAETRLHAQRALEEMLDRRAGFVPGHGFPSPDAEDEVRSTWAANGGYRHDAPEDERSASVAKWRAWLAAQEG